MMSNGSAARYLLNQETTETNSACFPAGQPRG